MTDHAPSPEDFALSIRPLGDQVLILRDPLPTRTKGGIEIPPHLNRDLLEGRILVGSTVLAIGAKVQTVAVGERAHLRATVGREITDPSGVVYHLVREGVFFFVGDPDEEAA